MDFVLKGARVIDPVNNIDGIFDIGIEDGKIAAVEATISGGKTVIDCTGKTVLPGVMDTHVHVTKKLGGHVGYYMAAKTGVTTIIDFAGPIDDIVENAARVGCGLSVGCLDAMNPDVITADPSRAQVDEFIDKSLETGAIGMKILGGHYPLTPEASRQSILSTNERGVIVAYHAGSTEKGSDIHGMQEAIDLAKGSRMILAHVNSYCRGKHFACLEELEMAFKMLRDNPNVLSDSYMSIMNGTSGACQDGAPHSIITRGCLARFGFDQTEDGMEKAMLAGVCRVVAPIGNENFMLEGKAAYDFWREKDTQTSVSFPMNSPVVAVACVVERRTPNGEFLIPLSATDGGGFPRNDVLGRLLSLYRLGYLSLNDIIYKTSINAARVFGLNNKGHLSIGADADITVLNEEQTSACMSFANGKQIMKDQVVTGSGARLITTERGIASATKHNLPYILADLENSAFYRNFTSH